MLVKQGKKTHLGMVIYSTYKNGDAWGMGYYCFTHIKKDDFGPNFPLDQFLDWIRHDKTINDAQNQRRDMGHTSENA